MKTILGLSIVLLFSLAGAHQGSHSMGHKTKQLGAEVSVEEQINFTYLKSVKPIFQKSCFDCHSDQTVYPWYHSLPIVGSMIDRDITDAKEHLDLSADFPFGGHGSDEEDLATIKSELEEEAMPPSKYLAFHSEARLSATEKTIISRWVDESLQLLTSEDSFKKTTVPEDR